MPFPESLELCRVGFTRTLSGEQKRVEFDTHIRCRRRTRERGVKDTCCWIGAEDQKDELEAFHRSAGGSLFQVILPSWEGPIETTARFDTPLTLNPVAEHYEMTASLYIPQPSVMDQDTLLEKLLAMLGVVDGTFNDALHVFVNEEWPAYWEDSP